MEKKITRGTAPYESGRARIKTTKFLQFVQNWWKPVCLWLVIGVVVATLSRVYCAQASRISSDSMTPTLQTGDFIIVYKLGTLAVDDIVVFHVPERNTDFVKRCVALAGDTVEVRNKDLFVNNVFIPLPPQAVHGDTKTYPKQNSPRDFFGPYVVPNDHFFVMGDNRDDSFDSRYLGAIPNDQIVGLAVCTYWSWNNGLHAERIFCGL